MTRNPGAGPGFVTQGPSFERKLLAMQTADGGSGVIGARFTFIQTLGPRARRPRRVIVSNF